MNGSSDSSTHPKQPDQGECCDLYGEYCYPCHTPALSVKRGTKQKKQRKGTAAVSPGNS